MNSNLCRRLDLIPSSFSFLNIHIRLDFFLVAAMQAFPHEQWKKSWSTRFWQEKQLGAGFAVIAGSSSLSISNAEREKK